MPSFDQLQESLIQEETRILSRGKGPKPHDDENKALTTHARKRKGKRNFGWKHSEENLESRRRERIDQRSSVLHVIHLDIMPLNVIKGRERVSNMHLPLMLMMRMSICIKGRRLKKMSMIPKNNTFSFQLSQGLSPPIVILG
jgi:hypothetical protein